MNNEMYKTSFNKLIVRGGRVRNEPTLYLASLEHK
jgi:hypothetical protein